MDIDDVSKEAFIHWNGPLLQRLGREALDRIFGTGRWHISYLLFHSDTKFMAEKFHMQTKYIYNKIPTFNTCENYVKSHCACEKLTNLIHNFTSIFKLI